MLQFGLGKETTISKVTVLLANDRTFSIDAPKINTVLDVKPQVKATVTLDTEAESDKIEE